MKNLTKTLLLFSLLWAAKASGQYNLNSHPSAIATIFLDFDGHTVQSSNWNGGVRFTCAPSGFNAQQITEIFNRVSEDYVPFNVNITTDSVKFQSAPLNRRIRIIITPTSAWRPGVGGIAYVSSFTWSDDTPAFVFSDRLGPNNPKYVAECITHESGHTLGLSHQSSYDQTCTLTQTYNLGTGTGEISWAPVMGNSYYRNMTGWNNGPTPYGCTSTQDNLTIITSQNGFNYKPDDFIETLGNSTYTLTSNGFSQSGLIATPTDKDAFKFNIGQNSSFHFEAHPYSIGTGNDGANLDIRVDFYDATKTLIRTYNPSNTMSVVFDTTLSTGLYYFIISGTGNINVGEYSSLGRYNTWGTTDVLPIREVSLLGTTDKNKHNLSWNIISDEPIKSQELEVSDDGIHFRALHNATVGSKNFIYSPYEIGNLYYRLKVTSVIYQTVYSNTVVLKASSAGVNTYNVSTLVNEEILVNASQSYTYKLSDANGRTVAMGTGQKGINKINITSKAGGLYIIQLINNNQVHTERIIKQ